MKNGLPLVRSISLPHSPYELLKGGHGSVAPIERRHLGVILADPPPPILVVISETKTDKLGNKDSLFFPKKF